MKPARIELVIERDKYHSRIVDLEKNSGKSDWIVHFLLDYPLATFIVKEYSSAQTVVENNLFAS